MKLRGGELAIKELREIDLQSMSEDMRLACHKNWRAIETKESERASWIAFCETCDLFDLMILAILRYRGAGAVQTRCGKRGARHPLLLFCRCKLPILTIRKWPAFN